MIRMVLFYSLLLPGVALVLGYTSTPGSGAPGTQITARDAQYLLAAAKVQVEIATIDYKSAKDNYQSLQEALPGVPVQQVIQAKYLMMKAECQLKLALLQVKWLEKGMRDTDA